MFIFNYLFNNNKFDYIYFHENNNTFQIIIKLIIIVMFIFALFIVHYHINFFHSLPVFNYFIFSLYIVVHPSKNKKYCILLLNL